MTVAKSSVGSAGPVLLCLAVLAVIPVLAEAQGSIDLAIENVTVIDPASGKASPHRTVLIAGTRIVAVEPYDMKADQAAARTLAGRNRFLIPGLLDMHVHLPTEGETPEEALQSMASTLDLLLANGVTGVRDMASDCWRPQRDSPSQDDAHELCLDDLRRVAEQIRTGQRDGPRLLALASPVIAGAMERGYLPEGAEPFFAPGDAADARQLARYLSEVGFDLVKVYNSVPREAYFALLDEARRLQLEVSGHLPLGVSVLEAARAGQRTIEHARDLPLACSSYGPSYREVMAAVVNREPQAEPPDAETRLRRTLEGFDDQMCLEVFGELVKNGTFLVPTHGTREMDARAGDSAYRNDRRLRFIPAPRLEDWLEDLGHTAEVAPQLGPLYQEFYDLGLRLTGLAHQAGVKVMVGTDANDTMIFPGFGLHDELQRLRQAGLEPMEILRAATTVPAEYLGRSEDLGAIAPGRLADLLLLERDPLLDISDTRRIRAVVMNGRVHTRADLDARLRRVANQARASKKTP